jgi:hypothetical protein
VPASVKIDNGDNAVEDSAKGTHFSIVVPELCTIVGIRQCVCIVKGPGKLCCC